MLIGNFDDFQGAGQYGENLEILGRAIEHLRNDVKRFTDRLLALESQLIVSGQDRVLRLLNGPHSVVCKGNLPEPYSRHDSFSQAVFRFAWRTFQSLPWRDDEVRMAAMTDSRAPGSALPAVDYEYLFKVESLENSVITTRESFDINIDTGNDIDTGRVYKTNSRPVRVLPAYRQVREDVLKTRFDTSELELLLRREYAAVADATGGDQDNPDWTRERKPGTWQKILGKLLPDYDGKPLPKQTWTNWTTSQNGNPPKYITKAGKSPATKMILRSCLPSGYCDDPK